LLPGGALVHDPGDLSSHRMMLDMRRGAFLTECSHLGRLPLAVRVRTLRLVSLRERAVGLQLIQLEIDEGEVEVTLEASFEGLNRAYPVNTDTH
jgi:trehalose/maltose hydrolase-like predicted phosphorylase